MAYEFGYERERFVQVDDQFECIICSTIVRDPRECNGCGHLYCKKCLDDWQLKNKDCPNRCQMTAHQMNPISKALLRIYNNLEIKCKNQKCNKVVKLCDLEKHELDCCMPNCINFEYCNKKSDPSFNPKQICSLECEVHQDIIKCNNQTNVLKILQEYAKKVQGNSQVIIQNPKELGNGSNVQTVWRWDQACAGTGIRISNNGTNCYLQENAYMFRTILGDTVIILLLLVIIFLFIIHIS